MRQKEKCRRPALSWGVFEIGKHKYDDKEGSDEWGYGNPLDTDVRYDTCRNACADGSTKLYAGTVQRNHETGFPVCNNIDASIDFKTYQPCIHHPDEYQDDIGISHVSSH